MESFVDLLKSCENFQEIFTLQDYFAVLNSTKPLNDYPITSTFSNFMTSTLIALHNEYNFPSDFNTQVRYNYCALVDNVISGLLSKKNSENSLRLDEQVQTLGYCYYKTSGNLRKNPMITLTLKSVDWESLHTYIGSDLITHIIEGKNLSVFIKPNEAYVQVIGINVARLLKPKIVKELKFGKINNFKEFKNSLKEKKNEKSTEKVDILSKLPLINRVKMLYNSLIRNKFKLPNRNLLNLAPPISGKKIAEKILGLRSQKKYFGILSILFSKFAYKYQRISLGSHINKHCPFPKAFKKDFNTNISENFTFEWLFANHCSLSQVCNFLITLIKKVIPLQLLGSKHNFKVFQKGIAYFLKLGVWEKVSCAAICSRFHLKDFKWITEIAETSKKLLVGKIVTFIFNDFLIPVLQISFYITEKQHDNSCLFYYRKPLWSIILENAKKKMESADFFTNISQDEKKRWEDFTKFPPAKLRIQPKICDFRPIMHFKSKISLAGGIKLSGNSIVAGIPQILRNSLQDPEKIMCLDYPSIITRISEFSKKWKAQGSPELFFICMDIAKAFDSVKINSLINMLEDQNFPIISSYYKFIQLVPRISHKSKGNFSNLFKMKFKKIVSDEGEYPFFCDLPLKKNSINVLTAKTSFVTSEKIKQVTRVLQGNIIKFNRQYFKAQKGVPQGFPCSPLLSNLYYSRIEQELVPLIHEKYKNDLVLILRLHDDYLILTSSPKSANEILQQIENIANQHNFGFAHSKISSNLPDPGHWIKKNEINGWVGLNINKTLEVTPSVSENASKQVSFDFVNSKITLIDLKNKLIKMTNLTINLMKFRSLASPESLHKALARLIHLQASRFLLLLKIIRKIYPNKHSPQAICRIIVNVLKFSAKLIDDVPDFFKVSVKEFAIVFKSTEYHSVYCKLKKYLFKLDNSVVSA